jgi:hypothetical protein
MYALGVCPDYRFTYDAHGPPPPLLISALGGSSSSSSSNGAGPEPEALKAGAEAPPGLGAGDCRLTWHPGAPSGKRNMARWVAWMQLLCWFAYRCYLCCFIACMRRVWLWVRARAGAAAAEPDQARSRAPLLPTVCALALLPAGARGAAYAPAALRHLMTDPASPIADLYHECGACAQHRGASSRAGIELAEARGVPSRAFLPYSPLHAEVAVAGRPAAYRLLWSAHPLNHPAKLSNSARGRSAGSLRGERL